MEAKPIPIQNWQKEIDEGVYEQMRNVIAQKPEARWAVYQNQDFGSYMVGHLRFLLIGPNQTFQTPPSRLPDTRTEIGWRYQFVGFVDFGGQEDA